LAKKNNITFKLGRQNLPIQDDGIVILASCWSKAAGQVLHS